MGVFRVEVGTVGISWIRPATGACSARNPRAKGDGAPGFGNHHERRKATVRGDAATTLWRALFGSRQGLIGVHCALRPRAGSGRLERHRPSFFAYPERAPAAARWCLRRSDEGLEAYFCAHLLTRRRRTKENAAPVVALWADADGGRLPPGGLEPTAIVETSPGRAHLFWSLSRPVPRTKPNRSTAGCS